MKKILFLFMMFVGIISLYGSPPIVEKVQLNDGKNMTNTGDVAYVGNAHTDKIVISQRDTLMYSLVAHEDNKMEIVGCNDEVPCDGKLQAKANAVVVCQKGIYEGGIIP